MFGRRLTLFLMLMLCLFRSGLTPLRAQSANALPEGSESAAGRLRYFYGVTGQVGHAGVYELPTQAPLLVDVIRLAKGLTEQASGNIRIIRHGRAGQQTFYSPHSNYRLLPGDLLVVDGRRGGNSDIHPVSGGEDAASENFAANATGGANLIQIALVGLIGHPVVLHVAPEDAHVERLIMLLGQSRSIGPTVQLIEPRTAGRPGRLNQSGSRRLASGTVLVFDPSVIRTDRIQPLPPPIRPVNLDLLHADGLAAKTKSGEPAKDNEPSTHRQHDPPGKAHIASSGPGLPFPPQGIPALARQTARRQASASSERSSSPAGLAASGVEDRSKSTTRPSERYLPSHQVVEDEQASFGKPGRRAGVNDWPKVSTTVILAIGSVFGFAAIVILWSMARVNPSSQPIPEKQRKSVLLDALIKGELVVTEEPLKLPEGLSFHGRPAGHRKIRLDAKHSLQGSHAMRVEPPIVDDKQPDREPIEMVGASVEGANTLRTQTGMRFDGQLPSGSHSAPSKQSDLLDRVLSGMHGAGQ